MTSMNFTVSRRDLLKGLACLGLVPAATVEQVLAQTRAPVRVLLVALQHGWGISGLSNQAMSGSRQDFKFPAGLAPFNEVKQHAVVIDSLLTLGHWGNNHDLSYADIFTAGVPKGQEGSSFDSHMPLSVTPSLDYLLEQASGKPAFRFSTRYRSWGVEYHPISIDDRGGVLPFYTTAYQAHQSLFKGQSDSGAPDPSTQAEAALVERIFKFVRQPAQARLEGLDGNEREKLLRYLTAVTDVERRAKPQATFSGSASLAVQPKQKQTPFDDLTHYLDMIKVGFANGMTDTAVLGIGDIHGIDKFHHEHAHADTEIWWETRRQFADYIATFVKQLAAIEDIDGRSLLDNTVIVLSGEVGDGQHDVINKGHILFGRAGGKLETNRFLKQQLVQGYANVTGLMREDIDGVLQRQLNWGSYHTMTVGSRTNADLLREVGNLAGLQLSQFGLPSQNKGGVLAS